MNKHASALILTIFALFACLPAWGQTDPNLSQYYEVPSFYNPAATGNTDFIRIRGGSRMQWVGIDGAPRSFIGLADMPMKIGKHRIGLGINFLQESIGLYKTLNAGAQISYKLRKWGGTWSAGLQIGLYDQSFKGSEIYIPDGDDYHESTDDALPRSDIHGTTLDLGFGLWYEHRLFYAGLSAKHLNSPTVSMEAENASGGSESSSDRSYEFKAKSTIYFTAGSNIPIKNTLFEIMPSFLVKSDFTNTAAELTARARWRKFLSFGVGYRFDDALIISVAAEYRNFYIGYSYDYATSAIHQASSGSHEIMAGYSLKLDLSDKNRHRHKSVRIL